jgi:hypothetical protein
MNQNVPHIGETIVLTFGNSLIMDAIELMNEAAFMSFPPISQSFTAFWLSVRSFVTLECSPEFSG